MPTHSADISNHFMGLITALTKVTSNNEEMKDTIKHLEQKIDDLKERIIDLEADVFPEEISSSVSLDMMTLL